MNDITTGYSELQILLKEIGIKFKDCGPADENLGKKVYILIEGEDPNSVQFRFFIDSEGNEKFLYQD